MTSARRHASGSNSRKKRLAGVVFYAIVGLNVVISAELTARLSDVFFDGVPFWANPSEDLASPREDNQLQVRDEHGVHGRPSGKFKRWRLNNYGFRGPDVALARPPNCVRVMALGASETFGYYEKAGMEFPAQLSERLTLAGCYEVINAAMVGLELASMRRYWENWASRFRPDVVLIYPTPHFYLNENVTRRAIGEPTRVAAVKAPPFELDSRFLSRLRQIIDFPEFIQKRRNERSIAEQVAGKDASWFFRSVPQDRVRIFAVELEMLVTAVQKTGAQPVVMTHAFRAALPLNEEDYRYLAAHRVFMPRAMPDTIAHFEMAANAAVREIAARRRLPLIDLAREFEGRREYFADLVHFTDEGAGLVADVIAESIVSISLASRR